MATWNDQNVPYLSPYYWPVPNSAKFRENIEIPWQLANSVAQLKIPCVAENCGPYWFIVIQGQLQRIGHLVLPHFA